MSQSFWESEPVEEQQLDVQEPELQNNASELGFQEPDEAFQESVEFEPEVEPEPMPVAELVHQAVSEPAPVPVSEPTSEPVSESAAQVEPEPEPKVLELSVDEFTALEERVLRAVNLVKRERLGRLEAEQHAAQLEVQLAEQRPLVDQLQAEVHTLRGERDQVRQRVERLLAQLDALEI